MLCANDDAPNKPAERQSREEKFKQCHRLISLRPFSAAPSSASAEKCCWRPISLSEWHLVRSIQDRSILPPLPWLLCDRK
jgi:hypothetical protein